MTATTTMLLLLTVVLIFGRRIRNRHNVYNNNIKYLIFGTKRAGTESSHPGNKLLDGAIIINNPTGIERPGTKTYRL